MLLVSVDASMGVRGTGALVLQLSLTVFGLWVFGLGALWPLGKSLNARLKVSIAMRLICVQGTNTVRHDPVCASFGVLPEAHCHH